MRTQPAPRSWSTGWGTPGGRRWVLGPPLPQAGDLPSPRYGLRGATLGGIFHVTGGYSAGAWQNPEMTEVLAWNFEAEAWAPVGNMTTGGRTCSTLTSWPQGDSTTR